jgi:hypothetical protein
MAGLDEGVPFTFNVGEVGVWGGEGEGRGRGRGRGRGKGEGEGG